MMFEHPKNKCEVDAISECVDLLHNGYFLLFYTSVFKVKVYKFRHKKNGRTLTVRIYRNRYEICEDEKVLKAVGYIDRVISD